MKVFVIEDEAASIESARMQLGEGHELAFFTTAMEVRNLLPSLASGNEKPDLILTDVNIPMGEVRGYDVKNHYSPSDMIPAGLVVALRAATLGIPCLIITDSNSHRDMIGLLLDVAALHEGRVGIPRMVDANTRPDRIETPSGMGKDWLDHKSVEEVIERLATPMKSWSEEMAARKAKTGHSK